LWPGVATHLDFLALGLATGVRLCRPCCAGAVPRKPSKGTGTFGAESVTVAGRRSSERSVFGVRRSVFGARCSAFGVRRSVFGARSSALGVRRSVLSCHAFEHRTSNIEHRTSNFELRTPNFEHRTSNTERPNAGPGSLVSARRAKG